MLNLKKKPGKTDQAVTIHYRINSQNIIKNIKFVKIKMIKSFRHPGFIDFFSFEIIVGNVNFLPCHHRAFKTRQQKSSVEKDGGLFNFINRC